MRRTVMGVAVAAAVGLAASAYAASNIIFDYNGAAAGGQISVLTFDWTPNSALAQGAVPLAAAVPSIVNGQVVYTPPDPQTQFTVYTQAALGNFLDGNGDAIGGTGLGTDFEITYQLGFSEQGYAVNSNLSSTAYFSDPAVKLKNFFTIYYDTNVNANALAGTGYDDGTPILMGVELTNNTFFGVPLDPATGLPAFDILDKANTDNYPGTGTVVGSGGGVVTIDATTQDADYFVSNITSLLIDAQFNTSDITPFDQVDPSQLVVGQTPVFGGPFAGFDHVNGFGFPGQTPSDFLFQADANMSFNPTGVVPEPGTMILLGSGLLGLAGISRRKMKK